MVNNIHLHFPLFTFHFMRLKVLHREATTEQIRYYPSNAKALTAVYQFGVEIGKIIPDENEWKKYRKKSG